MRALSRKGVREMENNLTVFNNSEFGDIRTVVIDGEPWFVAKDVAVALGYKNTNASIHDNVDDDDRRGSEIPTPSGAQTMNVINESGMYSLVFNSRLESAKKFKKWVTSEVLPQIRKTGTYSATPQLPTTANERLQLCMEATVENNKRITVVESKVEAINDDIADLRENLPLFPVEADEVVATVKRKGVDVLGGKSSIAYHDGSIRSTVYRDIHSQIWREFDVRSYKALPRRQLKAVLEVIDEYRVPRILRERIDKANADD